MDRRENIAIRRGLQVQMAADKEALRVKQEQCDRFQQRNEMLQKENDELYKFKRDANSQPARALPVHRGRDRAGARAEGHRVRELRRELPPVRFSERNSGWRPAWSVYNIAQIVLCGHTRLHRI